jgi:Reverse transcriptase (RNA-dependent DNA polymerase)
MPRGFSQSNKMLKLEKSLHGLKQAPCKFFMYLKAKLELIAFKSQSNLDRCLFVSNKVICLVYVDDTPFYSPQESWIDKVIQQLKDTGMDLAVEGEVAGFLGVHITRDTSNNSIYLTQPGLINRIINAVGVQHLPIKHTLASPHPLVKDNNGLPINGTYNYSSVVGMLQYLQNHNRPNITYAVSQCARFVHSPWWSQENAIIRICQYLRGTSDKGMIFRPSDTLSVDCYVHANFAGLWLHEDCLDPTSVKRRLGFVIKVANCPVFWGSKLQGQIALSTMEAEYNALSPTMRELLPFKDLVSVVGTIAGYTDTKIATMRSTVWEDNVGELTLANMEPGRHTPTSKHYGVKIHWFWSHHHPKKVVVKQISTKEQQAEIMTKGLTKDLFVI